MFLSHSDYIKANSMVTVFVSNLWWYDEDNGLGNLLVLRSKVRPRWM